MIANNKDEYNRMVSKRASTLFEQEELLLFKMQPQKVTIDDLCQELLELRKHNRKQERRLRDLEKQYTEMAMSAHFIGNYEPSRPTMKKEVKQRRKTEYSEGEFDSTKSPYPDKKIPTPLERASGAPSPSLQGNQNHLFRSVGPRRDEGARTMQRWNPALQRNESDLPLKPSGVPLKKNPFLQNKQ